VSIESMNPRHIVIAEDRQRKENIEDVAELAQSIAKIGLIHPIVVRNGDDGQVHLVAGERRLRACLNLGRQMVPVRFLELMSREEAEVVELEENIKRKELFWRDHVRSVGRLHNLYKSQKASWKVEDTANEISTHVTYVRKILHVYEAIDSNRIAHVESVEQAYNTLQRFAERQAEAIVGDIIADGANLFGEADLSDLTTDLTATTSAEPPPPADEDFVVMDATSILDEPLTQAEISAQAPPPPPPRIIPMTTYPEGPIVNANFLEWVATYNGPKFSLIHCDFPYGNYRGDDSKSATKSAGNEDFYDNTESVYWTLLDGLTLHLDRIMSYSAHMIFWFNMNFYTQTVSKLRGAGLFVHDHPLVWHKTGGPGGLGVVPGNAVTYPRRTYDTALLAVRGSRPLAKPGMNSYAAPTVGNKIHPSQKPEPMLRHFLQMVVDETTTMLDPTCGSAAALRAAEDLGAKHVVGIEMDENYAKAAQTRTLQARVLRAAGKMTKNDET
jgi:ParB/RepB/Spo0J family partition protein